MNNITIYDLAKITNLSPATVSKVLNNYKGVSKKAQEAVNNACLEFNYIPNNAARTLSGAPSKLIGVAFSHVMGFSLDHPHFSQILQSFVEEVELLGYDVILINEKSEDSDYLTHCLTRHVDGVLVAIPPSQYHMAKPLINSSIPCVSIEDIYDNIPNVLSDNYGGAKKALSHLYSLGHRKIALMGTKLDNVAGTERHRAYLDFLRENNLEYNDKLVITNSDYTRESGLDAIDDLLAKCWDDTPTAIFCAYDEICFSCMQTLQQRGYKVPQDISLVGFDDLRESRYSSPPLTTIAQNRIQLGKIAARTLVHNINTKNKEDYTLDVERIPTRLIVRNSTMKYEKKGD